MNGVDPHACLSATLNAIFKGHKQSQIDDLLPWNYAATV
jgi:transposase